MSMLLSSLRLAVRAILANKMRSFLTMLGVIIGVTSMVALVSIGQGATVPSPAPSRPWERGC